MDKDLMRQGFEAKFETPHGVFWCGDRGRYLTTSNHVACVQHQGRWEGWQASRDAVVLELPMRLGECDSPGMCSDPEDGKYLDYEEVKKAIEAHGLKVKP